MGLVAAEKKTLNNVSYPLSRKYFKASPRAHGSFFIQTFLAATQLIVQQLLYTANLTHVQILPTAGLIIIIPNYYSSVQ